MSTGSRDEGGRRTLEDLLDATCADPELTPSERETIFTFTVLGTVAPDTTIECLHCETEYTLRESLAGPGRGVRPGDGFPLSDTHAGFVIVAFTTCTKVTECLTTSENARGLAERAGVTLMTYHRRKGGR